MPSKAKKTILEIIFFTENNIKISNIGLDSITNDIIVNSLFTWDLLPCTNFSSYTQILTKKYKNLFIKIRPFFFSDRILFFCFDLNKFFSFLLPIKINKQNFFYLKIQRQNIITSKNFLKEKIFQRRYSKKTLQFKIIQSNDLKLTIQAIKIILNRAQILSKFQKNKTNITKILFKTFKTNYRFEILRSSKMILRSLQLLKHF
jgi:hypothetical protein